MTVLCLSLVFVAQLEPTCQIVICFLFAQPLVCKLLSVNQATNYTAAAAEWNHFFLRGSLKLRKICTKSRVMATAFLFIYYEISWTHFLTAWQTQNTEKIDCPQCRDFSIEKIHLAFFELQQMEFVQLKFADDNWGVQNDDLTKTADSE